MVKKITTVRRQPQWLREATCVERSVAAAVITAPARQTTVPSYIHTVPTCYLPTPSLPLLPRPPIAEP